MFLGATEFLKSDVDGINLEQKKFSGRDKNVLVAIEFSRSDWFSL